MTLDAEARARLLPFYLATTYRARTSAGPIDLRIGQPSPALDRLLDSLGAGEWAFVSAANPRSRALSPTENDARHNAFRAELARRGLRFFEAEGIPEQAGWSPEPSLLVMGVALDDALPLARGFGQNAIVCGERGAPARLVWCESDDEGAPPLP